MEGGHPLPVVLRPHWSIENAWHHLRDVGFAEDACQATARGLSLLRTWHVSGEPPPDKAKRERRRDPRQLFAWWAA